MTFNTQLNKLMAAKSSLDSISGGINKMVQSVCDFDIFLEYVPGDGWCFGSDISGSPLYMRMVDVLAVVEKKGRFTVEDWDPFC